jgi:tetratricopeptide (TPR) repeat protein
VITHGGSINGFNTAIVRVPAKKQVIILLNNTGGAPLSAMSVAILGILYDRPYALPKRSVAGEIERVITGEGTAKAVAEFDRMKALADAFDVNENELNNLGYRLLQDGKVQEAIAVFTMNVGTFPRSWNVYDSLGEAYMTDGRIELAIVNYERSVELNPKNEGGKKALEQLKKKPGK